MSPSGTLELTGDVARGVLEHALETRPLECCGVLLGPDADHADEILRAENVHDQPRTRYEIDPDTLLDAVQRAEERGRAIVGFYHSHPRGAAAFSETDRTRGSWEGLAYLLVSLSPLTFVAGRWDGETFEELDVRVPEEGP